MSRDLEVDPLTGIEVPLEAPLEAPLGTSVGSPDDNNGLPTDLIGHPAGDIIRPIEANGRPIEGNGRLIDDNGLHLGGHHPQDDQGTPLIVPKEQGTDRSGTTKKGLPTIQMIGNKGEILPDLGVFHPLEDQGVPQGPPFQQGIIHRNSQSK